MQRQNYMITAEEVAESMGISLGYAYKLLRKLNKELADTILADSVYHELKDTTIPEYLFIRDLPGGAGGRSDII